MGDDYIRREDAKIGLSKTFGRLNADIANCVIDKVEPADVVPVVRCKDCKYNATTHKCLNPDSFFLIPKDDDYCSYGERRGEHDGR